MAKVSDELRDIEQALDVIVRWSQYRFYSRVMEKSSVTLDRSTISILNRLIVVGPQLLPELASYLQLDRSTISRQAMTAVHLGVVEKTAAENGSRAYQLSLTEYGRDCIVEVRSCWLDLVRELLSELSPRDQRGLSTYLPRLSGILEATFESG